MITIRYELTGAFAPLAEEIRQGAGRVVEAHLEELHANILQSFEEPKSGETYARDDGSLYQASAPGEPPAIKEGELFASFERAMLGELAGAVWTDDEKAVWLNYGAGAVEPRPFWEPTLDQTREAFIADMERLMAHIGR